MKSYHKIGPYLLPLLVVAGCASTKVTSRDEVVTGKLPRPDTIWVHDFAATPADVPDESALAGHDLDHETPQTPKEIATGRKLGAEIASQLIDRINGMGMQAERASAGTTPQINDIVIKGYLISIKEGSAGKRFAVGFGSGASDLKAAAEGFQMTSQGLRKLGSGTTDAEGAKTPGADLGVAGLLATHNPAGLIISSGMKIYGEESGSSTVKGRAKQTANEIADEIKKRCQQEGWIK